MAPRVFVLCILFTVGLLAGWSVGKCNCAITFQLVNNWKCGSVLVYINCRSIQYGRVMIAVFDVFLKRFGAEVLELDYYIKCKNVRSLLKKWNLRGASGP